MLRACSDMYETDGATRCRTRWKVPEVRHGWAFHLSFPPVLLSVQHTPAASWEPGNVPAREGDRSGPAPGATPALTD